MDRLKKKDKDAADRFNKSLKDIDSGKKAGKAKAEKAKKKAKEKAEDIMESEEDDD